MIEIGDVEFQENDETPSRYSAWLSILFIEHRQAVKRHMAAPFPFQFRQFTHQFKPHFFMALAAGREDLSSKQSYLMRQPMLRVNDAINSAFRYGGRAFKKLSHRSVCFLNNQPSLRSQPTANRCNSHVPSGIPWPLKNIRQQLCSPGIQPFSH